MKSVLRGAGIGVGCPLVVVAAVWLVQFVSMVLAPGPEGPNWMGCAAVMLWTLIFASPFLLLGGAIGAVVGAGVGTLSRRGRESDGEDD